MLIASKDFTPDDLNKGTITLALTVSELTEIINMVRDNANLSPHLLGDFDQVSDEMDEAVLVKARKRVNTF